MPLTTTETDFRPAGCARCNWTGLYTGTRRDGTQYEAACFGCQPRAARRTYTRFPRPVAAAVAPESVPALDPGATVPALGSSRGTAALQAFRHYYAAEYDWLVTQAAAGVNFAASLLAGIKRYGNLTPRQLAAVQRNLRNVETSPPVPAEAAPLPATVPEAATIARAEVSALEDRRAAPVPAAPVMLDMGRIFAAFDAAAASGLQKVRLTLGRVEFKRTGRSFRFGEGCVLAYYKAAESRAYEYAGYVDRNGQFHRSMVRTAHWDAEKLEAALDAFRAAAVDPQSAARTHGNDTGYCSCCRRLLTDPVSVMQGIGPVCIERFGWARF